MLGLRPRLTVVNAVNVLISGTGKGHCRLKPRMSSRSSVPLVVQICPGKLQKSVTTPGATAGARARAPPGAAAGAPGAGAAAAAPAASAAAGAAAGAAAR